jgi:DNA-binding transcriptional LysR family regulator
MADFDVMATFVAVVKSGGFRGAATAMRIPRSTVSHRIARLEQDLGVRLLERTTRKLRMTDVGGAFFERCVRILADVEDAHLSVTNVRQVPRGTLRVACTLLFGHLHVIPVAAAFMRKYPDVEMEIVASNRRVNLVEEGFDLAVVALGSNEDSSLVGRKLTTSEFRCFASSDYVAAHGLPARPDELLSHRCIVYGDSRQTTWRFERPGETRTLAIRGCLSVNSLVMAHAAAVQGIGLAVLPSFMCRDDVGAARLHPVLPDWIVERSEMRVVYPSNRYLAPRVRLFVDALIAGYNQSLGADDRRKTPQPAATKGRRLRLATRDRP